MKNFTELPFLAVTASEASAALAVSRQTLYAYVSRGLVRAVQDPADAARAFTTGVISKRSWPASNAAARAGRSPLRPSNGANQS